MDTAIKPSSIDTTYQSLMREGKYNTCRFSLPFYLLIWKEEGGVFARFVGYVTPVFEKGGVGKRNRDSELFQKKKLPIDSLRYPYLYIDTQKKDTLPYFTSPRPGVRPEFSFLVSIPPSPDINLSVRTTGYDTCSRSGS